MDETAADVDGGDSATPSIPSAKTRASPPREWITLRPVVRDLGTRITSGEEVPERDAITKELRRRLRADRTSYAKWHANGNVDGKRMVLSTIEPFVTDVKMEEEAQRLRSIIETDKMKRRAIKGMRINVMRITGEEIAAFPEEAEVSVELVSPDDYRRAFEMVVDVARDTHGYHAEDMHGALSTTLHAVFLATRRTENPLTLDDNVTVEMLERLVSRVSKLKSMFNNAKNLKAGHDRHRGRWTEDERAELELELAQKGTQHDFLGRTKDAVKYEVQRIFNDKYGGNRGLIAEKFPILTELEIESFVMPNHNSKRKFVN
jgi:hypothetical protein